MTSGDPTVQRVLRYLEKNDPEKAARIEKVIRNQHEDAFYARDAARDLAAALRSIATDVSSRQSAVEHVLEAIDSTPDDHWPAEVRKQVALEYLAKATDSAFATSGHTPERFLSMFHSRPPSMRPEDERKGAPFPALTEEGTMGQIRNLRDALRRAQRDSEPYL